MTDPTGVTGDAGDYRSYLLRLWRVNGEGQPLWRASLRSAASGMQTAFSSLAALCEFLHLQLGQAPHTAAEADPRTADAPPGDGEPCLKPQERERR